MTQKFVSESCMRGHHIYKDVWVPDPYSVAMINSSMTVAGHELMAEEGTLEDSAPCGLGTAESCLKQCYNNTKIDSRIHIAFTCYHAHIFTIFIFASSVQFLKFAKIFHHKHFLEYSSTNVFICMFAYLPIQE